jgi:protein-export membrane protein SecD
MKRTRGLWVSIIFVSVLVIAALIGFLTGSLAPTLGLDLRGGVAVILSAPEGTPPDVMDQALENIRRRVDSFGVGEPDIFSSGSTIEVQIPGASDSTIEERDTDLYCVAGPDGATYGCSETQDDVQAAADGLEVTSQPAQICIETKGGERFGCYSSATDAQNAIPLITVTPKASSASATPSASGSPSASPTEGPTGADAYCLTGSDGAQPLCYGTAVEANAAKAGLTTAVTRSTWCLTPTQPEPTPTPTPTSTGTPSTSGEPSASLGPSSSTAPSASIPPSPSPAPSGIEAFGKLDLTGADPLPCSFDTKAAAQAGLEDVKVEHHTTQYCVVSSAGEDLGCFRDRADAVQQRRETGQQRLLQVIGTTARLEERPTLEIITPQDPRYRGLATTCGTTAEQETPRCTGDALDGKEVVYLDPSTGDKVRLGPVVITGDNITRATAQLNGGTQQNPISEWEVVFDLDGDGARSFGEATTRMASLPQPTNQLAIILDRQLVSNPVVREPITGGTGSISGGFTEQSAKDLASLLNAGSLPVQLTQESVRTVSPTLGEESLKEGVIAGIAGLILLFLYLLFYYRLLGIVAWFGMAIWALLAVAIVSLAHGVYALTLAGVAGLVISLGVTADSYIVFFERLKDELRSGRSARSVIQPAFKRAFRTIVAADVVTGIAAVVLYLTAVSSVRGFALTLGVATALDLFVVWFFKRPTVFLLSRNRRLAEMRAFGLRAAAAADHEASEPGGEPA